jgi:hypothetical protein
MRSDWDSGRLARRCAIVVAALIGLLALTGPAQADFGVQQPDGFQSSLLDSTGMAEATPQAGAHPFTQNVEFSFNTKHYSYPENGGGPDPDDQVKTTIVDLPPGLIGNPQAVPQCALKDFPPAGVIGRSRCQTDAQIGTAVIDYALGGNGHSHLDHTDPLYNLEAPKGVLARIGFIEQFPIVIDLKLRSNGDYGLTAVTRDISSWVSIFGVSISLWGVPADSSHDLERFQRGSLYPGDPAGPPGENGPLHSTLPRVPFMSNPTHCGVPMTSTLRVDSWQNPGNFLSYLAPDPMNFAGCDQVEFEPSIEAKPTTTLADAPSGQEFHLHILQNLDPDGLTSAHLRDAVVTLPEGMTVNPPAADVLSACSLAQVGMTAQGVATEALPTCPTASTLGKAVVVTPSLDHPLKGTVYLARQNENPFDSLLAIYLVIEDEQTGILFKLPGKIDPDPNTGRLTVSFKENPQTPVEDLDLRFFGGPHGALKTPDGCGGHVTTATLTPWTAPDAPSAVKSSTFTLSQGPDGGACPQVGAQAPNRFSFAAGTADSTAKAFSPFSFKLTRADGTQQLKSIDTVLPKGLLGKLAGTTYCSEASLVGAAGKSGRQEQASPSCPASSRVGSVDVGAGVGATPLYVSGSAYLAGPYKGAPLSLAVITPAVAGPFDLGTVVVRTALKVNPETAEIDAVSDPLPQILQGIPLTLRSVAVKVDRNQFTLNPTNCNPMSVTGSATSVFDQPVSLQSPFQVDECGRLGFKPKLALSLKGGTKRGENPALKAVLTARPGDANIGKASVALPHSEFLAQDHIKTICTRVQFAANACPAGSVYGSATATSPLLDKPLSGPVYLRSSSHALPDLVVALNGQIDVDLVGRIDSKNGGIRTTFDEVPDAPVSKFTLRMKGGAKSLLENSRNLCNSTNKATVQMDAQNGKAFDSSPQLSNDCKAKAKKKTHKHGR